MINTQPNTRSFTISYQAIVPRLKTEIGLNKYTPKETKPLPLFRGKALWDTGATNSAITSKIVESLKLIPIGKKKVTGANATKLTNIYLLNIFLPNQVVIIGIPATEIQSFVDDFDVLIGMDIITKGDFSITNCYLPAIDTDSMQTCQSLLQ